VGNPFQLVYISFFFIISNKILLKEDYFMYILSTQRSLKKVYHYDWTHLLFFYISMPDASANSRDVSCYVALCTLVCKCNIHAFFPLTFIVCMICCCCFISLKLLLIFIFYK
jgi:hypothetical protein